MSDHDSERWKIQVWVYRRSPCGKLEILLLQTTAERGNYWQPITGWVEPGESLEVAARREAEEETGWSFPSSPLSLDLEFSFKGRWGAAREKAFALEAGLNGAAEPRLDSSEHLAWKWIAAAQALSELPFDSQKRALERLIEKFA